MIEAEVEQAKQRVIICGNGVLLRSSEFVSQIGFNYLLPLPQYHIYSTVESRARSTCFTNWRHQTYVVESCAVWEVLYMQIPQLTSVETIIDAVQNNFPVFDHRNPLYSSVKTLLRSHYEDFVKETGNKVRPGRRCDGIIKKIDGVFCFDPIFRKRSLVDLGPQDDVAPQRKPQIF